MKRGTHHHTRRQAVPPHLLTLANVAKFETLAARLDPEKPMSAEKLESLMACPLAALETMVRMGMLPEEQAEPDLTQALKGMVLASDRELAGQSLRLDGPGLAGVRATLGIYRQTLEQLPEREYARVVMETARFMQKAFRESKAGQDYVEVEGASA